MYYAIFVALATRGRNMKVILQSQKYLPNLVEGLISTGPLEMRTQELVYHRRVL